MQGVNGRIFDLGTGALRAFQEGIAVTGHNIANANTPGFSRQRLMLETNTPFTADTGQMQAGVRSGVTERVHDSFLLSQIRSENRELGRWEAQKEALDRVEIVFDESYGYGLNRAMSDFFEGWLDLTNNPSGSSERAVLAERGDFLAEKFRTANLDLSEIQTDLDAKIGNGLEVINRMTEQIADLNLQIGQVEIGEQEANDLRDKRDLLLRELSLMIDVSGYEDDEGLLTVTLGESGRPLVVKASSWELTTEPGAGGHHDVTWVDSGGLEVVITSEIRGGRMAGWIEARDRVIGGADGLKARLDELTGTMINEVNALHEAGFGLNGDTDVSFFAGNSAESIAVDPQILGDSGMIAAASELDGVPGDNRNAVMIAELHDDLVMDGGTSSLGSYFDSIVADVGSRVRSAGFQADYHTDMAAQLANFRESVSGVNLDEEMVNLVQYQNAYEAASKLISVSDEMLDVLMNMI